MKSNFFVLKASGEKVLFDFKKLRYSLEKSGASYSVTQKISEDIYENIYDGISTKEIYKQAFKYLKIIKDASASKYKLKQAIMELGPSGYPFEKFVSFLFKEKRYDTKVGVMIKGKCITHEIDVWAENEDKIILIECKYKNNQGSRTNIQVPLYIKSRFLDIKENLDRDERYSYKKKEIWIVTNAKFSDDAKVYSECSGINLLGWEYPNKNTIKEWIELSNLNPVTCLTTLSVSDKKDLLSKNIVACREINKGILESVGISKRKHSSIIKEINFLINK